MPVFLTPLAGLVVLAAALPLGAALLRERRLGALRHALALDGPGRGALATAGAAAAAVALLALAAAQPALSRSRSGAERTDAEAYVVLDVSRSMAAVASAGGPTRLARAQALALRLRDAVPAAPWGVASLTDRVLVHAFPTSDRPLFHDTVLQAVGIQRPAPAFRTKNATALMSLGTAAGAGFFARAAKRRLLVCFTDGESNGFVPSALAQELRAHRVSLLVVRLWSQGDRVYDARGRDLGYRPDPRSAGLAASLRAAGIPVVPERDFPRAEALAARLLGDGPTVSAHTETQLLPLAPLLVLAAIAPLGFALVRARS
ncbi:MAG TPA: vWA domain-containing protein [Gaiellaceae bacterium]|nr:vWA domain-containing protein [Gaiellaceae bacterium]